MPIFWGHGIDDTVINYTVAQQSVDFLKDELEVKLASGDDPAGLEFRSYPGLDHASRPDELGHLQVWLKKVIPA